jgi:cytochrome b561
MQPIAQGGTRYDARTMFYHWTIAALVVLQWIGAQTIDFFPKGPLRVDAKSTHIILGLLLGALLIGRIVWRLTGGRRLPAVDLPALEIVAKATHYGLYVLLVAIVFLGIFVTWGQGDSIFNAFRIPLLDPQNPKLGDAIQGWHGFVANAILILAGAHASAAFFHHYVLRDGVLARMVPWAEPAEPEPLRSPAVE